MLVVGTEAVSATVVDTLVLGALVPVSVVVVVVVVVVATARAVTSWDELVVRQRHHELDQRRVRREADVDVAVVGSVVDPRNNPTGRRLGRRHHEPAVDDVDRDGTGVADGERGQTAHRRRCRAGDGIRRRRRHR